jgi:hypothetical protein
MMRLLALTTLCVGFSGHFQAQATPDAAVSPPESEAPTIAEKPDEKAWSFSAAAYTYIVPESRDYVQPTFAADRGRWHLEARYNYEALDSGSIWIGANFSAGDKLKFEFTPMVGGVFGDTRGIAPGYKASLNCGKWDLYTEGEYVFDSDGSFRNFFYTWSELTLSPLDWFRFGLVVQHTKVTHSEIEIQRGFLVAFAYKKVTFTTYCFDPDASRPTVVLALAIEF